MDYIKQGKGTSTNGNAATRFFEEAETSADILGIDVNIIKGFAKQLKASWILLPNVTFLTYKRDSEKLFDEVVKCKQLFNMSPTVHGHIFLQRAKDIGIPLGRFS